MIGFSNDDRVFLLRGFFGASGVFGALPGSCNLATPSFEWWADMASMLVIDLTNDLSTGSSCELVIRPSKGC